jgi:hypothetical protein
LIRDVLLDLARAPVGRQLDDRRALDLGRQAESPEIVAQREHEVAAIGNVDAPASNDWDCR